MKRVIPALMFAHRYLGVAFCLVFVIWFAAGMVMVYKRMPEYSAEERLARLPALNPAAIRLTPAEALEVAGLQDAPQHVLLTSLQSRPVYHFAVVRGSVTVFADAGVVFERAEPADAMAIAAGAFPESRRAARYLGSLDEPDQWTIGNRFTATGALHHVALGDSGGTEVYVAEASGDIVMRTDRSSRLWGYAGPVMRWFYFTPLRARRGQLWSNLIIYGSVAGCVVCVLGLVIGVHRFSAQRRYRRATSVTPYVGWLRWHHYAGLLTMSPWNLFPGGGPSPDQARAVRGDSLALDRFTVAPDAALEEFQREFQPKEVELLQFMGAPFYAAYRRVDPAARPQQDAARDAAAGSGFSLVLLAAACRRSASSSTTPRRRGCTWMPATVHLCRRKCGEPSGSLAQPGPAWPRHSRALSGSLGVVPAYNRSEPRWSRAQPDVADCRVAFPAREGAPRGAVVSLPGTW